MAGTDCGDCGYPDCFGYSDAIAQGKETSAEKCAPGGADSKAMLETILVSLKTGVVPGGEAPAAVTPGRKARKRGDPGNEGAPARHGRGTRRRAQTRTRRAPARPSCPARSAQTLRKDELYKVVLDAMAGTDCGDANIPTATVFERHRLRGPDRPDRCAPAARIRAPSSMKSC